MSIEEDKLLLGTSIQLNRGNIFNFNKPDLTGITVDDFAFSLAKLNRFTGWTKFSNL